jgi:hypothetical protein
MLFGVRWVWKYRYTRILSLYAKWMWEFGFKFRLLYLKERVPHIH